MAKKEHTTSNPSAAAIVALLALALATSLLAVFQWMELLITQQGGAAFCGIDSTLDCAAVWNSDFAKAVHRTTRLPLAGWGLVWGLSAFFVSAHLAFDALRREGYDARVFALRLVAAGGALSSLALLGVSLSLGQICLTCVATYLLVGAFTFFAFRGVRPLRALSDVSPMSAALPVTASLAVAYAALLVPGTRTPVDTKLGLDLPARAEKAPPPKTAPPPAKVEAPTSMVGQYLAQLPPAAQQAVSDSLHKMRTSKTPDVSAYATRHRVGPPNAPVRIVDFSDIRCGHCKHLNEVMEQLAEAAPPGSFSSEPRFFPLDAGCNPTVPSELVDETGVRCLAPKVLVCLEDHAKYHDVRSRMFDEQQTLTSDRVYAIATELTGKSKAELKRCASTDAVAKKIATDVEYASKFDVHGTPVVLVNGRQATSAAPFLYALIVAEGDMNHPAFERLPPARADAHVH